jgi:Circadian oscillating protein COP23
MKNLLNIPVLLGCVSLVLISSINRVLSQETNDDDFVTRSPYYECKIYKSDWTTTVRVGNQTVPFLIYRSKNFVTKAGKWEPEERCFEITRRLNLNQRNNKAYFLVPGLVNGREAVCTSQTIRKKELCRNEDLLWTSIPGNRSASDMIDYIGKYLINTNGNPLVQSAKFIFKVRGEDGIEYNVLDMRRAITQLKKN